MSIGRSPRLPHLHSKGGVKLRGVQAESAIITHRDARLGFISALKYHGYDDAEAILNMIMTKFDGYVGAETILNMDMSKFDGYVEADATMFAGKKYDGYIEVDIKNFAITKYDGYYESTIAV